MAKHRFRIFIDGEREVGDVVELNDDNAHFLKVIRARSGDALDVVDAYPYLYVGRVISKSAIELVERINGNHDMKTEITVVACVLKGQAWDALVDGCVQAGAVYIHPVAMSERAQEDHVKRMARSQRVAMAAAKQAKRMWVPDISPAISQAQFFGVYPKLESDLQQSNVRIVLDESAPKTLVDVVSECQADAGFSVFVGGSEGLPPDFLASLKETGWQPASLGPTVLRSELAAAVATSVIAQRTATG